MRALSPNVYVEEGMLASPSVGERFPGQGDTSIPSPRLTAPTRAIPRLLLAFVSQRLQTDSMQAHCLVGCIILDRRYPILLRVVPCRASSFVNRLAGSLFSIFLRLREPFIGFTRSNLGSYQCLIGFRLLV